MAGNQGNPAELRGDEVYQPDTDPFAQRDDTGLLDQEDTLDDQGAAQKLDEGYSPPERPRGAEHTGVTAGEQRSGETLDERLAEEVPDVRPEPGDGIGDQLGTNGEPRDREVGRARSGRLVAPDEGTREHSESGLTATDVGVDSATASAEEAAMHTIEEEPD